jgi:hypothetical protein
MVTTDSPPLSVVQHRDLFINAQMLVFYNDLLHVSQMKKRKVVFDSLQKIVKNEYKVLKIPSRDLSTHFTV